MEKFKSDLSGQEFPISERVSGKSIRQPIMELIQKDFPQFSAEEFLSLTELNDYREKYITEYLVRQTGELTELEQKVIDSISDRATLSDKLVEDEAQRTFGQKIADKVAAFGGSWTFIIAFLGFILIWICLNVFWLANRNFDPFPFILLNLILSCIAAIQAPVIMMSQNRQESKDRERAKKDYMINLKAELEIRSLHEKIDHLILRQQQEIVEMQKVQTDMLSDIAKEVVSSSERE
ncbi:MAG TPA: DUF1003 domain-containing protein [Tenuifilaceae bacterium]|nr:DUF1003 domain-containing protein [Bacteroidales bacterium]HNT41155.1 DUF1003 domain-containing protein [Tenuifilaceae bacterium]NLI87574.1 DUF1003 domain-containing protein [Bacteroidales bacterium]HNY08519.1 DUF1003 domain-containing protein [Tenuifilaceae bacterium]HPH00585.1 DUF1003 domain-containing protein [Tenuifilaceae bacterium]